MLYVYFVACDYKHDERIVYSMNIKEDPQTLLSLMDSLV